MGIRSCTSRSENSCNLLGVRVYEVQPGDTPASIAAQDAMAGCPKCSRDLVVVNPHKETVTYPNGFVTFKELRAGEKLNLPEKWFNGELDKLPPSYFAALPYADGVTPGKQQPHGLGAPPYSDRLISAAKEAYAAIGASGGYCDDVARVGTPVNRAVHAFKLAWNATENPPVPINTGNYELPTAEALRLVLGEAFEPCDVTTPQPVPVAASQLSRGAVFGIAFLGASAAGSVIYLATRKRRRRRR